jgi:hypothetical protein
VGSCNGWLNCARHWLDSLICNRTVNTGKLCYIVTSVIFWVFEFFHNLACLHFVSVSFSSGYAYTSSQWCCIYCLVAALLPCCILYVIHQQALRTGWQYCTHKHVSTEEDAHLIDLRMFKQLQRSGFVWGTVGAVGLFSCHILSHPRSSSEAEGGGADCAATRQRESRSEILFLGKSEHVSYKLSVLCTLFAITS